MSALDTSPDKMFLAITDAYMYVLAGKAKRLDGDGWTVYAVGSSVIRVDIRVQS